MIKREQAPEPPFAMLAELAMRFRGKMASTNILDANVCRWTHPAGKSWESTVVSGEAFSKQLRLVHRSHKVTILANSRFLAVEVMGSYPIQPASINEENANYHLLKPAKPLRLDHKQYSLFTKSGTHEPSHKRIFEKTVFLKLIRDLDLRPKESLHFMTDSIAVYLDRPSFSRVVTSIENLIELAVDIEAPAEELDLRVLPVQFQPLIPLIRKWAIADDSDREDFLASLTKKALAAFVRDVEPYLSSIDSYLDSFGGELPEAACALGRLAEAALEAKRALGDKKGTA